MASATVTSLVRTGVAQVPATASSGASDQTASASSGIGQTGWTSTIRVLSQRDSAVVAPTCPDDVTLHLVPVSPNSR